MSPAALVVVAALVAVSAWRRDPLVLPTLAAAGSVLAVLFARPTRRSFVAAGCAVVVVLAAVAGARAVQSWSAVTAPHTGPFVGWARVIDDPQPFASATRLIVEIDGQRFEIWGRGRTARETLARRRAGEWVTVAGTRRELPPGRQGRVAWQHVVGEFSLDWASDAAPGGPLDRASNRVRAALERAAGHLRPADGALFRGLVIGDDRDQSPAMIHRFRASGLSHLTAVSGQNVAFVLAAAGPLLSRLRPMARLLVTLGLIGWFVALTRYEPSILRAGVMASVAALSFFTGAVPSPVRHLSVAVTLLVLGDPLIVHSVGFWLSVGATLGVVTSGPALASRLSALGPLALPAGITLGAQVGVALPSVLVFGRLPLVSVPANLLAVPVAGAVMLYGLPAGLIAGWCPPLAPVLMVPAAIGTRWVDTVAALGARSEPPWPWGIVGWFGLAVLVCALALRSRAPGRQDSG